MRTQLRRFRSHPSVSSHPNHLVRLLFTVQSDLISMPLFLSFYRSLFFSMAATKLHHLILKPIFWPLRGKNTGLTHCYLPRLIAPRLELATPA